MKNLICALLLFTISNGFQAGQSFAAESSQTEVTITCARSYDGGQRFDYCVHRVPTSTNNDLVYFLHGINGSSQSWSSNPEFNAIYDSWGTHAPTVVSVSYGPRWILAEHNTSAYSGLYEHFTQTALPAIELAQNLKPARRLLLGLSMGGFNSSQLYLKNPELFKKVVLICPAISSLSPFATPAETTAYVQRTHAVRNYVLNAAYLSRLFFPTEAAWAGADPLALAATHTSPTSPEVLVTTGLQDEYGFFEGSQKFVQIANAHGARATWIPVQGGHCSGDWKTTMSFLVAP